MSVIVMGMEMPKKAMFAAIFPPDDEHGTWYISVVEGKGKTADYELIHLPEKHGRLISADEAYDRIMEQEGGYYIDMDGVGTGLDECRTIVEAEEN